MRPEVCYLHIGKTAGTYVKSIAQGQEPIVNGLVRLCGHNETLKTTSTEFPGRKIAFTFRDPIDRFCSAFDSRLRNGRPTYSSIWSNGEAVTFSAFRTPNGLAEALDSSDDYQRSAADYGMQAIAHLRRGYSYHFHSLDALESEVRQGCVIACADVVDLDRVGPAFFAAVGLQHVALEAEVTDHRRSDEQQPLSARAESNLRRVWAAEFSFYDRFRSIAENLDLARS